MKTSSKKLRRAAGSIVMGAVSLALLAPGAARAQGGHGGFASTGPSGFGAQGQIAIDGTLEFRTAKTSGGNTLITIEPAGDYFIAPNVSVGGKVGLTVISGRPGETIISLGARAGVVLNLNERVGFWPLGGLTFNSDSFGNGGASSHQTYLELYAPALFHPVTHLFIGLGPFVSVGLGSNDPNVFGLQSVVGGWF